ncbi:hypothetical protein HY78_23520 [Rhizorhabdus wittichii DC-6]|uniref:Uncharacterized protein n=1 Tax=Rhizorhabdus wittichii TaxID=160791 RepID=A0A975D788_9SPHN|nr:hypothetical protein [Rhizorhabdus wittichii]ARR56212.1 hypothetical protein HY78_23520 [Rhizorhabdus wittichii DC-6]QTH22990.1 hypothetical protein HRJ34_05605 [Rhizorhabdus wittichii]
MQSDYAWPTLLFVALAVLSVAADWRRHRRREADRQAGRTGWVPWPLVTVLALIMTALFAAWWIGDK